MFNLQIDNENVELDGRVKLQMSRLILDLADISKRGIKISNALSLPFTKKNDRLTGYPSRLNSNNLAFENNPSFTLTESNNIVSTGEVIIKSFDEKAGIKIQLAEGYDFWRLLGRLEMLDLDLFQYDEIFDITTFDILKNKTDSIWLWGLTHDSDNPAETTLNSLQYSRPQYRTKRLIDEIIEQAGFEVDYTNVVDNTILDDMGLMSNASNFSVSDYMRSWEDIPISAGDIDQTSGNLEFEELGNVTLSGNDLINQLYATSYVIKGNITAFRRTILTVTSTGAETTTFRVSLIAGNNFINFRTDELEIGNSTVFSLDDDVIFEKIRIYSHMNESDIVEIEGDWRAPAQRSINNDYLILSDYNLPTMTQARFFKTVITQLFLKVDIDPLRKKITLSSFSDVLNTNNAIDLTGKTQRFPPYTSGKAFGQLNTLTYRNEDDISPEFGRATFNVLNKNAKTAKQFISMAEYSASKEILIEGNTTVKVEIYDITQASRVSKKDRPVIFATGTGIPFTAQFLGIGWQDLYSKNYIEFVNSIIRERVMKANMLITHLEFNRISDSPIAFIGELNSYFLVLSLSGFEEGELTSVNMVKFV